MPKKADFPIDSPDMVVYNVCKAIAFTRRAFLIVRVREGIGFGEKYGSGFAAGFLRRYADRKAARSDGAVL